MQSDVLVTDSEITGTIHLLDDEESPIVQTWGAGNFIALKFELPEGVQPSDVRAGLDPSEGSGLVPLDDDLNGVWKITDKDTQKFKVVTTVGERTKTVEYDLSNLVLEDE